MANPTDEWGQASSSLPSLSNKELLKRYRMRVESAQSWRKNEGYDQTWERMRDLYRLRMFDATSPEDRIVVAVTFATINVIEPSVAINHPKFTVLARNEMFYDQATISEAVLNYQWEHHSFQKQFRLSVRDFLIYGHGWLKLGWRYVEEEVPRDVDAVAQEAAMLSEQADIAAMLDPQNAYAMPSDDDILENVPKTEVVVLQDAPYVERVSPFDVYVDPEGTNEINITWMAQRVVRPIEEVRLDARYKARVRRKLQSDGSTEWHLEKSSFDVLEERERVTLWEFYDLKRGTMCVFAESGDDFLVDPQPFPYEFGLPFVMFRDYDVPDQFYPIGELEALEPLQAELNETRSAMVRARKLSIRKFFARADEFNPQNVAALKSDEDNSVILVEGTTPFDQIIGVVPNPTLDPQFYAHSDVILQDMDRVSAISDYQRGVSPEVRRTATEASIIQDAANARAADKLGRIENSAAECARKLLQLLQQYMPPEEAARVSGHGGQQVWFTYQPGDIEGEFDFSVEAGSMQPKNETFRRMQAQQLAVAMGPFVQMGVINPYALAEQILRDGFGVKNPQRFMLQQMPQAPPGAPPGAAPPQGGPPQAGGPPQPGPGVAPNPTNPMAGAPSAPPEKAE